MDHDIDLYVFLRLLFIFLWSPSFVSSLSKLFHNITSSCFRLSIKRLNSLIFLHSISLVYTWDSWKNPTSVSAPSFAQIWRSSVQAPWKKNVLFLLIGQDGIKLNQQWTLQTLNYFFLKTFGIILLKNIYVMRKVPYLLYCFVPLVENVPFIFFLQFCVL